MASCINISTVKPDELPLSSDGARPRRGSRALGLCFQGCHCALTTVLLAIVIWLGVSVRNRRNDILFEIRNPAVMFTQGQPAVSGYTPYGSLFRGSGSWVVAPDLLPGGGLSDHGVVAIGDYVYVFGGTSVSGNSAGSLSGRIYQYDTIYSLWSTTLPIMPVPYTRFAFAAGADTLYVVGGIGGDFGTGTCWDPPVNCTTSGVNIANADDAEAANPGRTGSATLSYNVTARAWRNVGTTLNVPRSDACAAVINGKVYVVGGYAEGYNITDSLEVLDPAASALAWRQLAPLPAPRGDLSCVALNGLLYVFGGYYDPYCPTVGCFNKNVTEGGDPKAGAGAVNGVSNFRTETWSYDPSSNAWTARASMRYVRGDAAYAVLPNGRIVVAGGERNLRTLDVKVPQHSVEIYYAAEDTWAEKAPMPYARFRFAAAAVGQSTYVFGGQQVCSDNTTLGLNGCQTTAADSHSVFFELDHPNVFVQLPNSAGNGLTYDMELLEIAYDNETGLSVPGGH